MSQKYFKNVVFTSIIILVYQGIANSDLGIISQFTHQNDNDWAGPLTTSLLFLGSGLGSMYNKYIGKYQYKFCFAVGSLGYIIFISLGLIFIKIGFSLQAQIIIFVLSFISGILCSVFYNTQFNYISTLSKIDNRQIKYFGINMGFAQSSSIFGNLVSSVLIKNLSRFMTVLVMDIISICSALCFLFVGQPHEKQVGQIKKLIQNKDSLIQSQSDKNSNKQVPMEQNMNNQSSKPPLKVICSFTFSGIIISFIFSYVSIIIYRTFQKDMDDTQLNYLTFILFIFEGIGQFIGGMCMIFFSKKIKDTAKMLLLIHFLFMISLVIIYIASAQQNRYIFGAGIVLLGFCDCCCFVLTLTIASLWSSTGISFFNLGQSLTVSISVMLMVFIPYQFTMLWIGIFYICNLVGLSLSRKSINTNKPMKEDHN